MPEEVDAKDGWLEINTIRCVAESRLREIDRAIKQLSPAEYTDDMQLLHLFTRMSIEVIAEMEPVDEDEK